MGGGGGGDTNVTNTGLGDDQYQTLADNQAGISGQITTARDDADAAYQNIYSSFDQSQANQAAMADSIGTKGQTFDFSNFGDGVTMTNATDALRMAAGLQEQDLSYDVNGDGVVDARDGEGMMSNIVGLDPSTQNTGLYKEFSDQTKAMTDQFGNVIAGQGDLNRTIGQQALGTQNAISANLDTLGQNMGGRFDTLDTSVGNVQGAVDQGFIDQGQRFDTLDTSVGGVQSAVDAGNVANTQGFADAADAMSTGFGDASTQLTNAQSAITEGQGGIIDNLDAFSGRADAYATSQLQNQADLQSAQDGFQSSFDTFTERYSDDAELAQQSRSDLATAQANQTDRLREDMGTFAQAAATGQQALGNQLEGVATGMDNQLSQLGGTVESGFVDTQNAAVNAANTTNAAIDAQAQATANQAANTEAAIANSITQMGDQSANILSQMDAGQVTAARDMAKLAAGQEGLDANMRADFAQMGSAFDDNGQLIKNSIDDQGNTITRAMDQQGNMLLKKFNVQGQETGSSLINIGQRLQQLQAKPNAGNTGMGTLTPQAQVGGFAASPFQQTGVKEQFGTTTERPPNPFQNLIPQNR